MAELIVSPFVEKLVEYVFDSAAESVGELAKGKIAPYFGGRAKLEELGLTMKFIQARLHDAERRGEGENEEATLVKEWLKSLKAVLFRLEDLFEDVDIADQENDEELQEKRGNKLPKCFCILFSRSSPFKINKLVSDEAKAIMADLESLKANMTNLGFRECGFEAQRRPPLVNRMIDRETGSYVVEETVFGRDDDENKIVGMLLDSSIDHVRDNKNLSVIPIVGIGGLGKTTLAQLVFNDKNVQAHFELKAWACISEITGFEEYTRKILKSIITDDCTRLTLEKIETRLREAVNNKKYLFVLDDVWDENRERWLRLKGLLSGGKQGSRIIVTSRSREVAKIMGTVKPYELGDLSEESSWALFKSLAFEEGQEERMPELTIIGREIVKKCANVPLAIRVVGALLYCKDTVQEWRSFKDKDLIMIGQEGGDSVMSTLKLSYDHLEPHLKQCFAYCSLYPKNYVFDKDDLIYHWMAQGYIKPSDGNHASPEDVGHGYFMELLRRSFFQDFKRDLDYFTFRCKMHDLMNDLAGKVAGDGCKFVDGHTHEHTVWHVSLGNSVREIPSWLFTSKRMRSLLVNAGSLRTTFEGSIDEILSSLRYLHTLDLIGVELDSLPDAVGELKHLRYLRLWGKMEYLPESITRLRNLQTLDLRACGKLKELPTSFNKLINLRHLLFYRDNDMLLEMPPRFGELTSLQRLSLFNVGDSNGLDTLATMNDLSGDLTIRFLEKHRENAISEAKEANLKGKKVNFLELDWGSTGETEEASEDEDDRVMQWLQPPPTVEYLYVINWRGRRFPIWGMEEDNLPSHSCSLPNLVYLSFFHCRRCQHLPPFSTLPRLRVLQLHQLNALEYIESGGPEAVLPPSSPSLSSYFPFLEKLKLRRLPELKGWSKEYSPLRSFYLPNLVSLDIYRCPKLMSMPRLVAPRLQSLLVYEIHGKGLNDLLSAQSPSSRRSPSPLLSLKWLHIEKVYEGLKSLSINLPSLEDFQITDCSELINITVECPSPLRKLSILGCRKLISMPLVAPRLESLEVICIHGKALKDLLSAPAATVEKSTSTITTSPSPWPTLSSLKRLEIGSVDEGLETLSIKLPSLEDLTIRLCPELINLTVECPSALQRLSIEDCPKLVSMSLLAQRLDLLKVNAIHGTFLKDLMSAPPAAVEESTSTTATPSPSSRRRPTLSSLKRLKIASVIEGLESLSINLPSLEDIYIVNCAGLINITVECPSPLQQLKIIDCPKLVSMPLVVPRLESLKVDRIHGKALNDLLSEPEAAVTPPPPSSRRSTLPSLKRLEIWSVNEGLESLSINLPSLEEFTIRECPELINIMVECPSPLWKLSITDCPRLMSMPLVAPRLESLEMRKIHGKLLKDVVCAPTTAVDEEESTSTTVRTTLSSLKQLWIFEVNEGPESLSINLPSLEDFEIRRCPELINITVECPSPLRKLYVYKCEKLRDKSGALRHLYPVMAVLDCPGLEEDMRRFTHT